MTTSSPSRTTRSPVSVELQTVEGHLIEIVLLALILIVVYLIIVLIVCKLLKISQNFPMRFDVQAYCITWYM